MRVDIILNTIKEAADYLKEDRNNLRLKTKYKKGEILMHKYSIDDFWDEVQKDIKNKDYLAFGLDSQLLINNILELFFKINGEFFRQPNEMAKILERLDTKFASLIKNFYGENDIGRKKEVLAKLVKYIYKKSKGLLPKSWFLNNT